MGHHLRTAIAPAYLALCLILGGASAEGYWVNLVLQLLAVPIIGWSLLARRKTETPAAAKQLLWIAFLALVVIGIQLISVPPEIWTHFPGRERIADGFELLNLPLPWMPISLAPLNTIASAIWLLPALAVLLAIVKLGSFKGDWIALVILVVTAAAVVLGALQILGGAGSQWELYEITNYGSATGFFANSNHMATLLLGAIPFLSALYLKAGEAGEAGRAAQRASGLIIVLAGMLALIMVGLVINGSLAGMGLAVPVIAVSILMILSRKRKLPPWAAAIPALLAAAAVYAVFTGPFGNNLVGEEASAHGSRREAFTITLLAAKDFFPLGSGIGTFIPIYRSYEDPSLIDPTYMNHAHSDYLELLLETGLAGITVFALFFFWWLSRAITIWKPGNPDFFARAATIASATILAHSIVDYPLRTAAIAALFAACCALMTEPRKWIRNQRSAKSNRPRHLSADD